MSKQSDFSGLVKGFVGALCTAEVRGMSGGDHFPDDVAELMAYLGDADPRSPVRAHPGEGTHVPIWILGSSLYGAQLAAHFGLPYAFASHFAPDALEEATAIYMDWEEKHNISKVLQNGALTSLSNSST